MKIVETNLPEVKIIQPRLYADERGTFFESWNAEVLARSGLDLSFVQDNHSRSAKGVLRGLHYQIRRPQGKMVRVVAGRVYDVAVDLRGSSPRFGQSIGIELSAENRNMLWIPPGFAHGFLALEEGSEFLYKCTDYYSPADERTLLWDDPALGIEWPLEGVGSPLLSNKDEAGRLLRDADVYP